MVSSPPPAQFEPFGSLGASFLIFNIMNALHAVPERPIVSGVALWHGSKAAYNQGGVAPTK
jgi:hypothetical protein